MTGRDGRTLEPSDDHFLQRIPLVVRVHWRNLPRWGGVRADNARDHVHCMRPLMATTVARLGGSNGRDVVGGVHTWHLADVGASAKVRFAPQIGIGGSLAAPPLPHHRTYGSVYGGSRSY